MTRLVAWKCPWTDCGHLTEHARCWYCGTLLTWENSRYAWCPNCNEKREQVRCEGCDRKTDGGEFIAM